MAGILDVGRLVATLGLNTAPFQAGMNGAQSSMIALSKSMMIVGRTMTRFVTLPMVLAGWAAVNTQRKFEASMTKIIGLVGVSRDVVEQWNKEVLSMAKMTGRGPVELADALYFVTSAGIRGADAMEVLEMSAKAAATGLGETKVIADLVTSAMNAYGKENLSAAQATDILVASVREGKAEADELAGAMGMVLPIASEFGVSFDQVGAAFAGMTRTGTNARVAATQLKAILSAMASPSKQAADAMAQFGINAETFRRTVREKGLIKALLDLRTATKGNEAALSEVFPNIRALMGVLDLLGANVNYNVKIFEALKNASGSLERAFQEIGGTTQQKLNVALATIQATFVKLGEVLKPLVTSVLAKVNDYFSRMSATLDVMGESQRKAFISLALLTAAFGPFMLVMSKVIQIINANPWFALATAIGIAALALGKWLIRRQTANKLERQSERQHDAMVSGINKEIIAINNLFTDLKTLTQGTEEWVAVRDKINAKYGAYITNLTGEKILLKDIEEAQRKVTSAKMADLSIKAYGEESGRLVEQYQHEYQKKMGDFIDFVSQNRAALHAATTKSLSDFLSELDAAMAKDIADLGEGVDFNTTGGRLSEGAKKLYDDFIKVLNPQMLSLTNPLDWNTFITRYVNLTAFKQETDKQVATLDAQVEEFQAYLSNMFGDPVDVTLQLKSLDAQIEYTTAVADSMGKQLALQTLITLHLEKAALLTGDAKQAEEDKAAILRTELALYGKITSSLGTEASLEGEIDTLISRRKLLKGNDLKNNSKALALARQNLEALQLEMSGYGEIEMLRGRISLEQKKQAYMTLEEQKASESLVRSMQQLLGYKEAAAASSGRLAMLGNELKDLKAEEVTMDGDAAKMQRESIQYIETEIILENAMRDGLNKESQIRAGITQKQAELNKLSGEARDNKLKEIAADEIILIDQQLQSALLSNLQRKQLDIQKIEINRGVETNPAIRAEQGEQLKILRAQEEVMARIEGRETGEVAPEQYSKDWFKKLQTQMSLLKELKEAGGIAGKAFRDEWGLIMGELVEGYNYYFQMINNAAAAFTEAMISNIEKQKERELSAVGDNATKRAAIEEKYYKKQKRWAIFESLINTQAAIGNALATTKPFIPAALIAAGIAGTAGLATTIAIATTQMAKGGLVYGNTIAQVGEYPGASSNPEVIAPLSKLKGLLGQNSGGMPQVIMLRAEGRDLVGVINMENLNRNTY